MCKLAEDPCIWQSANSGVHGIGGRPEGSKSSQCAFPTESSYLRECYFTKDKLVRSTKDGLMQLTRNDIATTLSLRSSKAERRNGSRINRE